MNKLYQGDSSIIQTKKTVDWLINNTRVKVFNPMTFEGYQRNIDEKHCDQIVSYLSEEFFLPTSIISPLYYSSTISLPETFLSRF